eukprot:gene10221-946_t
MTLNVGGRDYRLLRSTLAACEGPLAVVARADIPPAADERGHPYIDGDPELFRYVVNYLRRRRAFVPAGFSRWAELRAEFDFFALPFPDDAVKEARRCEEVAKEEAERQEREAKRRAEEAEEAAERKRKRSRGPVTVTLTIVDYGGEERIQVDGSANW